MKHIQQISVQHLKGGKIIFHDRYVLVVKIKLPVRSGSVVLRQLNGIHIKRL